MDRADARAAVERPKRVLCSRLSEGLIGPNMRYISVTRVSVRPGHTAEHEEARRMIKAAHEAAHLTDHFTVWESTSETDHFESLRHKAFRLTNG